MLTIFANIRINSPKRLQHMKDSFLSFGKISDDWLVNVRGKYRVEAINFLKKKLGNKMTRFDLLEDSRGWMINSLDMLRKAKYDYVLIWNEDHLNLAPQNIYPKIIKEMEKEKVDYMLYSWWHFGRNRKDFESLKLKKLTHIETVNVTAQKWKRLKKKGHKRYLISSLGIFKNSFLEKLMIMDSKKYPALFSYPMFGIIRAMNKLGLKINEKKVFPKINRIFANKLARYPKITPHELEKDSERTDILPLKFALSKRELFACIDDDNGVDGYQLIKRGLYPKKFDRHTT